MFVYSLNLHISSNFHRFRTSQTATLTRYKVPANKATPPLSVRFSLPNTSKYYVHINFWFVTRLYPETPFSTQLTSTDLRFSTSKPETLEAKIVWLFIMWNGGGKNFVPKIVRKEHQTYLHVWFGNLTHAFTRREVFFLVRGFTTGMHNIFEDMFLFTLLLLRFQQGSRQVSHLMSAIGLSQSWISLISIPTQINVSVKPHTHISIHILRIRSERWCRKVGTSKRKNAPYRAGHLVESWSVFFFTWRADDWKKLGRWVKQVFFGVNAWMVNLCGGGGLNIQNCKWSQITIILFVLPSNKTKHLLTLFMSCEQKRMGLGGCWVFWTQRWWWVLELFCSNDGVMLLPD